MAWLLEVWSDATLMNKLTVVVFVCSTHGS